MEKEKWINGTLESLEGIKKAEPNPFLFTKLLSGLKSGEKIPSFIPVRKIAIGMASMALLAVINIAVVYYPAEENTTGTNDYTATSYIPSQSNPYLEILTK